MSLSSIRRSTSSAASFCGDSPDGLTASKAYRDVRGEFLASTDERFRPVNLSLAPDGTLYVVDMYRGIIQHKGYMTEYLRDYVLTHKLAQFDFASAAFIGLSTRAPSAT